MIDSSLFCYFDENLHFSCQTYAASNSIFSLTKNWLNLIFSAVKRRIIFLSVAFKTYFMQHFLLFEIKVSVELVYSRRSYLISNVKKSHLRILKTWYLVNEKTVWNKFLTTKSWIAMLSVNIKTNLKGLVHFSENYFTFSVYFFAEHTV